MLTLCCNTRASFQGGFHEDGQPCQWEILCRADEGGVRRPGGRQVHQLGAEVENFCAAKKIESNSGCPSMGDPFRSGTIWLAGQVALNSQKHLQMFTLTFICEFTTGQIAL